jgi:hypothetical protein
MMNPTVTRYPSKTQWVWTRVPVFTREYGHRYEILLIAYMLAGGYLLDLTYCHPEWFDRL